MLFSAIFSLGAWPCIIIPIGVFEELTIIMEIFISSILLQEEKRCLKYNNNNNNNKYHHQNHNRINNKGRNQQEIKHFCTFVTGTDEREKNGY
jgi:hypothetical protein